MRRISSGCIALLTAVVAALAGSAGPASATVGWHFSPLVETTITDCYTSDVVSGVGEYAGAQYDDTNPPKTGDVFDVNVVVNGIDASCGESVLPEILLPAGVSTAIDAQHPITCFAVDDSTSTETPDTADCPQSLGAPLLGGTGSIRDVNGPAPGTWDTVAPNAWEFRIPLTATTAGLKQIAFPTQVISGSPTSFPPTLEPSISVPIAAGTAPPSCCSPPAPTPRTFSFIAKSSTAKIGSDGKLTFSVMARESGTGAATGTISLPRARRTLRLAMARLSFKASRTTRLALKLSKADARLVRAALKQKLKLSAKITLTAVSTTGDTSATHLTFKVRA